MVLILLVVLVGGGIYLYLPRGGDLAAGTAATLAILNTDITSQRGGVGNFTTALDGDILTTGDVVKSSTAGRGVLTFFDGSTLSVETGSQVKVTTLNHLDSGGIQVVIEQALGRSWASVSKLKTPDSKFELRTPTSTAVVRGTGFETNVIQQPDGSFAVTYKTDEGDVLVTANAGGQVDVTPNTQVTIATGQAAPAAPTPTPRPPTLRVTSSLGYALTAPTGASCGSSGSKEIFGCVVNGNVMTIREPVAGRYVLMMSAGAAANGATVKVDALRGPTVEATQTFTGNFAVGDLFRSAFTYGGGAPQTVSAFEPAEKMSTLCGALATGRVFSTGTIDERYSLLQAFAAANKGQAVAYVVTEKELLEAITRGIADSSANAPASVKNVTATIDPAGVHFSGSLETPVATFTTKGDVIAGAVNGKLGARLRNLHADPIPGALLQQIASAFEQSIDDLTSSFPMVVRQVAMRQGCLAVIGTTP